MCSSHVGHNSIVEDHVTLANGVLIAGHVVVGNHVVLGGGVLVHQHCTIGAYTMVGGGSPIRQNVPPYVMYNDFDVRNINSVGLRRGGFTLSERKDIRMMIKLLCFTKNPLPERIAVIQELYAGKTHLQRVFDFLENLNKRGFADAGQGKRIFEAFQLKDLALSGQDATGLPEEADEALHHG
jgi:UDP-N-acetylglucosamine acyltransferase